jgi:hypothetical protein
MPATTQAVYTQAQCQTMMDDTNQNPVRNEKRGEVHISLVFDGVDINPALIFDAIQTLGTVQADKVPAGGRYEFIIT